MTEIQNPKQKNNRFELEIGAWDLLFETPNSKAEPKNSDLAQRTRFLRLK